MSKSTIIRLWHFVKEAELFKILLEGSKPVFEFGLLYISYV